MENLNDIQFITACICMTAVVLGFFWLLSKQI